MTDEEKNLVQGNVERNGLSYTLKVPENERHLIKEIFEEHEYSVLDKRSSNGIRQIVDVGANVGLFAVYSKLMDPDSAVHCFEPSPRSLPILEKNVSGIPGIHVHPVGLSNGDGEASLHYNQVYMAMDSTKYAFDSVDSAKIKLMDAGGTLDELAVGRIDVLKIDTEGCEIEILESIGKDRLRHMDYVLVEYHSEEDRRQLDLLLSEFHLFNLKSSAIGLGLSKYVNSNLLSQMNSMHGRIFYL